ncbi:hypothetical protein FBU59_002058 [Linderina macrospora]|uniref:Uncharacterized protein n=1 Tax=Linderina macrospora TaxID=4868 RepID=A0ACC1JCF9_9FUNG|nr:hypothetical protein FBU59_002058 [Linderina macrospora]
MPPRRPRNLRKTRASATDWDEPATDPSVKGEVGLDDLVEFRQYQQKHRGIDTETLAKGERSNKRKKTNQHDSTNTDDDPKPRTLDSAFAAETNTVDVNKHMMAYIEKEMDKRKPTKQTEPDAEDDLYRIPDHLQVVELKAVNEGNVAMASAMLTSIPEVDLGRSAMIRNIRETESLVAKMTDNGRAAKDGGRVVGTAGSTNRFKKMHDPSERSSRATDDITMQKFKKRMRR